MDYSVKLSCRDCGHSFTVACVVCGHLGGASGCPNCKSQNIAQQKSCLDNVPVVEEGFPVSRYYKGVEAYPCPARLEVVSQCPKCGAPIYGDKSVPYGDTPLIRYSCSCNSAKSLQDTVHTK